MPNCSVPVLFLYGQKIGVMIERKELGINGTVFTQQRGFASAAECLIADAESRETQAAAKNTCSYHIQSPSKAEYARADTGVRAWKPLEVVWLS